MFFAKQLLFITCALFCCGCCSIVPVKRGMLDDHTFYSTDSPNIRIKIPASYTYYQGPRGQAKYQFRDPDNGKFIFIHHIHHMANETQIDYYNEPASWIFSHIPSKSVVKKGTRTILGEKWYTCLSFDARYRTLILDVATFTNKHDTFYIRQARSTTCGLADTLGYRELLYQNAVDIFLSEVGITKQIEP